MRFMWSYREMLAGDINWKKDVIQNLLNIAFFVPFGILFPLKKWIVILLSSCAFSVLIEAAQYFFRLGLCELVDVIGEDFHLLFLCIRQIHSIIYDHHPAGNIILPTSCAFSKSGEISSSVKPAMPQPMRVTMNVKF